MIVYYYQDRHVVVTSEALVIDNVRIPLRRLEYVWHREGRAEVRVRLRIAHRGLIGFALAVGVLLLLIGALYMFANLIGEGPNAGRVLLPLAGVVALIGFAGPILELALHRVDSSIDQGHQVQEICAIIDGTERRLMRIADANRFGKIYRALQRALEDIDSDDAVEAQAFAEGSEDGT